MPWCPVCKNEYVEGKTHCPDCDVDLVDELPEEEPEEMFASQPMSKEDLEKIAARRAATAHMNTYTSARSRQSETKSSAWTFLIVGGIGFLIITLSLAGVLKLPLNTFSLVIMEAMFLVFLVIAVLSFKKAMRMLDEIASEDSLETRVQEWAKLHLHAEELASEVEEDTTDEMKYFMISELIRERLMRAFPEIDDAYAEELTENFYNQLFS